jgi:hypothetical protein
VSLHFVNCDVQAVDSLATSRQSIEQAGMIYAVLFYFSGGPYKVTATHGFDEKSELESFIRLNVHGHPEEDWSRYRVDKKGDIDTIVEYARGPKIDGVTFNMVIV